MFASFGQFLQDHVALRPFNVQLRAYSTAFMRDRPEVDRGGKILLPQSALDHLSRLHIEYPMLFKLTNMQPDRQRVTHCGVLEFIAEEGKCYLPHWMMKNLLLEEGELIAVESVSLPLGHFVKFKPQNVDFLNITNPRAVLEICLRNFACLTKNDVIAIYYNDKEYELQIMDVKPANAVCIHECDLNVDFDAPVGYVDPPRVPKEPESQPMDVVEDEAAKKTFVPFQGEGCRLDGKQQKGSGPAPTTTPASGQPGSKVIVNYNYKPGKLTFIRMQPKPKESATDKENKDKFEPFAGSGQKLREKKAK